MKVVKSWCALIFLISLWHVFFFASFSQEADLLVDFVLEQIVGISDGRI